MKQITDLDLAPIHRTQANYYRAQYYQARVELVKANKGLRRLHGRFSLSEIKAALIKTSATEGGVNIHKIDAETWYEYDWDVFVANLQKKENKNDCKAINCGIEENATKF